MILKGYDLFLIEDGKIEKPFKLKSQNKYTVTGVVDGKRITVPNESIACLKKKGK